MLSFKSIVPIASCLLSFAGCAVDSTDSDLGDRSAQGYVVVEVDDNGGAMVERVDEALTECADGGLASQCHVESVDFSALDLSPEQRIGLGEQWEAGHVIVEGELVDGPSPVFVADPVESVADGAVADLTTRDVDQAGWPKPIPIGGQACGDVTCGFGLECCNASCGWCVPPGFSCIQIACN